MDAFIFEPLRTPRGRVGRSGALHEVKPIELVAALMAELGGRCDVTATDDIILGCVTQTGEQGANLAKVAALYAGWPDSVSGMTVNRFCASGLAAAAIAAARVASGTESVIAAGGVESMTRVPMFSDQGPWFADDEVAERTGFVHMAFAADLLAHEAGIERSELDAYAASSQRRAAAAGERDAPAMVSVAGLDRDETVRPDTTAESLARLPPLLNPRSAAPHRERAAARRPELGATAIEHRHTVGSSPALADAASLMLIGDRSAEATIGAAPCARVRSFATAGVDPVVMLTGNIDATERALAGAGLCASDIDLFEVNESFAVVPLHYGRHFDLDPDRLNVAGGAIALGHPLGATGGILIATLIDELVARDLTTGVVSICGGAGVASALVIERC